MKICYKILFLKVKHPFFLLLKFSNCISLYYNRSIFPTGDLKGILSFLQQYSENLSKIYPKKKKSKLFLNKNLKNAYLAIKIHNPEGLVFAKKVSELLGSFDKRVIMVVFDEKDLLDRFSAIIDLKMVKRVYEEYFNMQMALKKDVMEGKFLLEGKKGSFEPFIKKKLKIKEEKRQFIPEITTLIEIKEDFPFRSQKEKELLMKIDPEELFQQDKAENIYEKEEESSILLQIKKENNEISIKNELLTNHNLIFKNENPLYKQYNEALSQNLMNKRNYPQLQPEWSYFNNIMRFNALRAGYLFKNKQL